MPYHRSSAKRAFDGVVTSLEKSLAHSFRTRSNLRSDILELVYQSVVFRLSAALEDYVASLINDWVYQVKHNKLPCAALPDQARSYLLVQHQKSYFTDYLVDNDEKKLLSRLKIKNSEFGLVMEGETAAPLLTIPLTEGKKYPSVKNIKALFLRLGIENILDQVSKRIKSDAELRLKSFGDVRTAIAHQYPPSITHADVKAHLGAIKSIARAIDMIMFGHVRRISGSSCWK